MMKTFNSLQITAAFVGWPYLMQWLDKAEFRGAIPAFYSAAVLYVVAFIAMTACVYRSLDKFN